MVRIYFNIVNSNKGKLFISFRLRREEQRCFCLDTKQHQTSSQFVFRAEIEVSRSQNKKKNLWMEVSLEMQKAGYTGTNEDILDRKMRNMKKTYKTIKDSNNQTGRGRSRWEYFKTFEEIFADDRTINTGPTISSFSSLEESSDSTIFIEECLPSVSTPVVQNLDSSIAFLDECSVNSTPRRKRKAWQSRENYNKLKRSMEMEQERTEAIANLSRKIDESNAIQKERNTLLKQFLEKL